MIDDELRYEMAARSRRVRGAAGARVTSCVVCGSVVNVDVRKYSVRTGSHGRVDVKTRCTTARVRDAGAPEEAAGVNPRAKRAKPPEGGCRIAPFRGLGSLSPGVYARATHPGAPPAHIGFLPLSSHPSDTQLLVHVFHASSQHPGDPPLHAHSSRPILTPM